MKGAGWREETLDGTRTRMVFERPLKAEVCMCGCMWLVRRVEIRCWRLLLKDAERDGRGGGEERRLSL